jgi:adenylosuccinate synthase
MTQISLQQSKSIAVVGAQWGDEGKGKIIDYLSSDCDAVVRYQGGHNAGHTILYGTDGKLVLHLLPSAILHNRPLCVIGKGVAVNTSALLLEIEKVKAICGEIDHRIAISPACPTIQDFHIRLDQCREGHSPIGTTGRGIGPAYEDLVARRAIRICDLLNPGERLAEKLGMLVDYYDYLLRFHAPSTNLDFDKIYDDCVRQGEALRRYIYHTTQTLRDIQRRRGKILFEGAQGGMLSFLGGTYPYVTSSLASTAGIACGTGLNINDVGYVLGVTKAYATRVGDGPFPTELHDSAGEALSTNGQEFGATTGRKRRCGWLDAVALKEMCAQNGVHGLCVTKLDILDGLDELKICVAYRGSKPAHMETMYLEEADPIYETLTGWHVSTGGITDFNRLNPEAQEYVRRIEDLCQVPVVMISTGPGKNQIIRNIHGN